MLAGLRVMDASHLIANIVHPIGMAFSILVLVIIMLLGIVDYRLINRMTLRLIASIVIANLITHAAEYFPYRISYDLDSDLCRGLAAFRMFSRTFYCFTNLAISFHLYKRVVLLEESKWKSELTTWVIIFLAITPFMLLYYFIGAFNDTVNRGSCVPGCSNPVFDKVFHFVVSILNIVTMLVAIYVTFAGFRSLNHWTTYYATYQVDEEAEKQRFQHDKTKMAQRSFLYPLSTIIVLLVESVFYFVYGCGLMINELVAPMIATSGLAGTITAIVFFLDPALWHSSNIAIRKLRNLSKGKFYNRIVKYTY